MSLALTHFKRLLTICFITFSLMSCGSDDDDSGDEGTPDGSAFSAKVDGEDYNPPFATAFLTTTLGTILVSGDMGDGETIQLFIPQNQAEGTYEFGFNVTTSPIIAYYQETDGDAEDAAFANSGTITLSELDTENKKIAGTFSFTGVIESSGETVSVTEGQFNLTWEDI